MSDWRNTKEKPLKEVIEQFLKNYNIEEKVTQARLESAWEKMMGSVISKYTQELFLHNKVLHIRLSSSSLREELNYAKDKIISHINKEIGKEIIKDVVLR